MKKNLHAELAVFLTGKGADLMGIADLSSLPAEVRGGLPRAVAFGVALDSEILSSIIDGPTKEYYAEYRRVNQRLDTLSEEAADWLRERGFQAISSTATQEVDKEKLATPLPHKTAAHLAGLGWIGKSALLVTREFGSGLRLNRVLTDAPLPVAHPDLRSRCGDCNACVRACPGSAPLGNGWQAGPRDTYFNATRCQATARNLAMKRTGIDSTFCGICVAVCPWTKQYIRRSAGPSPKRL